jgi:malic enzyme
MDEEKTYKIMEKSNIFIGLITKEYFSDPDAVLQMRKVIELQKPCILLIEKPEVDILPAWVLKANIQATINFYDRDTKSAFKKVKVVMDNISDKV